MKQYYVLSMGVVFSVLAGWYYFSPKILGWKYNETLGQIHFFVFFIGVNLTFFPQHFSGLNGMPRRIPDYPDAFYPYQWFSSMGSMISTVSLILFIYIVFKQITEAKYATEADYIEAPFFYPSYLGNQEGSSNLVFILQNPPAAHSFVEMPIMSTTLTTN